MKGTPFMPFSTSNVIPQYGLVLFGHASDFFRVCCIAATKAVAVALLEWCLAPQILEAMHLNMDKGEGNMAGGQYADKSLNWCIQICTNPKNEADGVPITRRN